MDGTIFASTDASDATVVVIVVLSRLIVPLFIPRFPLVIIAALIIDAADQTVLAALTDVAGPPQPTSNGEMAPSPQRDVRLTRWDA